MAITSGYCRCAKSSRGFQRSVGEENLHGQGMHLDYPKDSERYGVAFEQNSWSSTSRLDDCRCMRAGCRRSDWCPSRSFRLRRVRAAVALQSKTPFHAMVTSAPTQAGTIPAGKSEMIWIDNTLYLSMSGRWVGGPMPPERALVGVTGGNLPFSECKRLPDATISGQPTNAYSAVMQSGEHVQLFISASGGQLLRETLDQHVAQVTVDFAYTNVHAPALGK
ncbi:MAG TPA: hypothetical protein VGI93_06235 [Steroidobacteraceae bacterium]